MSATEKRKKNPVVEVAGDEYQQWKAELEGQVAFEASQEELLRAVVREVDLELIEPKKKRQEG